MSSKSDPVYLHPGSLLLNISVNVCTRNRGRGECESAEDMERFGAGKDHGRQSVVMTAASKVKVC